MSKAPFSVTNALIAYDVGTPEKKSTRIKVGPLMRSDKEPDWTTPYNCTHGAAYISVREIKNEVERQRFILWLSLDLLRDSHICPEALHETFWHIDEYRSAHVDAINQVHPYGY